MHDTNQPNPDAGQKLPHPQKIFPDLASCRVKEAGFGGYFDCLSVWASHCSHALSFGHGHFCRHPTAPEILARSEVKKDKPA